MPSISASATARCSGVIRSSSRKRRRPASRPKSAGEMGEVCVDACLTIGYRGAGTFEFLYQDGRVLLHRDEHAHPGGAPGHGDDHGHRSRQLLSSRSQPARRCVSGKRTSSSAAMRSSAGSTPRTRRRSCRRPGTVKLWHAPGGPGIRVDSHHLQRLQRAALLRLDDRKDHRARFGARRRRLRE